MAMFGFSNGTAKFPYTVMGDIQAQDPCQVEARKSNWTLGLGCNDLSQRPAVGVYILQYSWFSTV